MVLYTGTPCQIEGLKAYLKKDYNNLYTQDIICHGVPSPKVWRKYLNYKENKEKKKITGINFRSKEKGWKNFSFKINYSNDFSVEKTSRNPYMNFFLSNICLRESCYNCKFKKINRISDITLADFWGIKSILPSMYDDKGTSLVIINSQKGAELFNSISNNVMKEKVDFNLAIKYNLPMTQSANKNDNRENFFNDLDKLDIDELAKKYIVKPSLLTKIKNKIISIIR